MSEGQSVPTSNLVTVEALAAWLEASGATGSPLRVCEVRWSPAPPTPRERYDAGHIPGACFVDVDRDLSKAQQRGPGGRHPMPEPAEFAAALARLGIGPDTEVVAYDEGSGAFASRLWLMLRMHGHPRARVLDGGLAAWTASGRPLSREPVAVPPAPLQSLARAGGMTVDRAVVRELSQALSGSGCRSTGQGTLLVDVRAPERFRGELEPVDPRAGHIPGAVNLPLSRLVRSATDPRLLPAPELREALAGAGLDGSRKVVAYCGSGVTACFLPLALEQAGLPPCQIYSGSFSDWVSVEGAPIAVGSES